MLAIETGIPLPKATGTRVRTGLVPTLKALPVGGSTFLADEETNRGRIGSAISYVKSHHDHKGKKFTTRKMDGGYRIWRTE